MLQYGVIRCIICQVLNFFYCFSSISILIPESDFEFKTFQNIDSFTEACFIDRAEHWHCNLAIVNQSC